MKCKLCGCNLDKEDDDNELDFDISAAHKAGLCLNCWFKRTYGDANKMTDYTGVKNINKISTSSNTSTTIEYLLTCIECQNQTGYGYLWFAVQDGRDHVFTSRHKLVTISEIVWNNDRALEIIRIDIKLLLVQ